MSNKMYDFGHAHAPHTYTDPDLGDDVERRTDEVAKVYAEAVSTVEKIGKNSELTVTGKQQALTVLEIKIKWNLKDWAAHQDFSKKIEYVKAQMQLPRVRPDDPVAESRRREIRDWLNSVDPNFARAEYEQAALDGNEQLILAVEDSPIPFTWANPDLIEKARGRRQARMFPKEAIELQDLELAQANLKSALKSVEVDLRRHKLDVGQDFLLAA